VHYGWVVVAASFVIGVSGYGTYFSFTLFYPQLVTEFGWSRAAISGALSLGLITYGVCALPMGWCVDRYGPRRTVMIGGALLGLGTALGHGVSELWHLYALYGGLTAVGMGAAWAPLVSTISRWFVAKRGLAIGLGCIGGGTGTLFVAPIVEQLLTQCGWREAYVWLGLGCGLTIVAASALLERDPAAKNMHAYGYLPLANSAADDIAAGRSGADLEFNNIYAIVRTVVFWRMTAVFGLWWFGGAMVFVQIAPYMLEKGFDLHFATLATVAFGAGNGLGKIGLGMIADKIGGVGALQCANCVAAVSMYALTLVHTDTGVLWVVAVFGFGFGGGTPQLTTIGVELFGLNAVGALMGALLALIGIVGAGGPLFSGIVFDASGSYSQAFVVGAVVYVVATIAASTLRRGA
jgi:MFS transporter, OFA family, oxalate/formate antiporter